MGRSWRLAWAVRNRASGADFHVGSSSRGFRAVLDDFERAPVKATKTSKFRDESASRDRRASKVERHLRGLPISLQLRPPAGPRSSKLFARSASRRLLDVALELSRIPRLFRRFRARARKSDENCEVWRRICFLRSPSVVSRKASSRTSDFPPASPSWATIFESTGFQPNRTL